MSAFHPDLSRWDPWRPEHIARLLRDVRVPWYVAAGWAIDLFLGGERREHEDLEIAVPQCRFGEIERALRGLEIFVITGPARAMPLAHARDRLLDTHQTWVREPASGRWRIDVFREPSAGDTWICRRDPSIRLPYDRLIEWSDDGIPYGRPEVVLLFKAKHVHQSKNEGGFAAALPRLGRERRRWLRDALARVHPRHAWLAELDGSRA
jgi:hypothetical protein